MLSPLSRQVQPYLQAVLGETLPGPVSWDQVAELPYFLQDAFEWRKLALFGHPVLLAIDLGEKHLPLREVKNKLDKVRDLFDLPILYVTGALASYERRQLIESKLPFLVPGNQLYLPDLGIDLREYFRRRPPSRAALSPAAQAVLLTLLLKKPGAWRAHTLAAQLDYTSMTLSRVVRELESAELITTRNSGRSRDFALADNPRDVWKRALPNLRTPIKRVTWTQPASVPPYLLNAPLAGLSALAQNTMISEPPSIVRALTQAEWKLALDGGLKALPEWEPASLEWQIWTYKPPFYQTGDCVDPFSLLLSLRDERDERVQIALDELRGALPW